MFTYCLLCGVNYTQKSGVIGAYICFIRERNSLLYMRIQNKYLVYSFLDELGHCEHNTFFSQERLFCVDVGGRFAYFLVDVDFF